MIPAHVETIRRAVNDTGLDRHSLPRGDRRRRAARCGRFRGGDGAPGHPPAAHSYHDAFAKRFSGVGVKNGINSFGKKNFTGTFAPGLGRAQRPAFSRNAARPGVARGHRGGRQGGADQGRGRFLRRSGGRASPALAARELPAMAPVDPSVRGTARPAHLPREAIAFEMGSSRPLDFGHWSAHKMEQLTHYRLRHGEAVAIGLALDVTYSQLQGWLSAPTICQSRDSTCSPAWASRIYDPMRWSQPEVFHGLARSSANTSGAS